MAQREIKFRAWDTVGKVMHDDVHEWGEGEWWRAFGSERMQNAVDGGECILMQYTGLKGKNGRDIYEGDVVRIEWKDEQAIEVRFDTGVVVWGGNGWNVMGDTALEWLGGCGPSLTLEGSRIAVVGNIYESPELINK